MKNWFVVVLLSLALQSCSLFNKTDRMIEDARRRDFESRERMLEEARANVAEARRTARPLTGREREAITALVLRSARDPDSTRTEFRGFSYELRGVRRADFFMNGRNGFGGMTGWILWRAEFYDDGKIGLWEGGLSQEFSDQVAPAPVGR